MCQCPLGYTGENCESLCTAPPGCSAVVLSSVQTCTFDVNDFGKGIKCLECKDGYYLTADQACVGMLWLRVKAWMDLLGFFRRLFRLVHAEHALTTSNLFKSQAIILTISVCPPTPHSRDSL